MKIGFLTPEFPHPKFGHSGGIGTSILNLSKGLTQLGNQVSIFVYGQSEDEVFEENGITFYRIKNVKIKGLSLFFTQIKVQRLVNSLVDKNQLDILETPDWTGFSSNIKAKCPLVIKLHGSDTYFCHLDKRPVKFLNKYNEKKALKTADAITSVSEYTANVTKELFELNRKIEVIPNSIDLQKFSATESNSDHIILYFGTLIRKKGLLELPLIFNEVFKQNKKAKLVLVGKDTSDTLSGNDSTWTMMQNLFDTKAFENVTYLGSVSYDEIKELIGNTTLCVFPTFAEALPVSWIEAMAMEKPIVASDIGWAKEIIDNGKDGYLVNPKSHHEFADKINELLLNSDLRLKFGKASRAKVLLKFSLEVVANQNVVFYRKVISNRKR